MTIKVQGKAYTWQLSDLPIGSGDAGEVYAVTCLEHNELTGVLKRPAHIATGGSLQRQAGQIAREGEALSILNGLPDSKAHPPRLLDRALDHTVGTGNYFIVSEQAAGQDLTNLLNQFRQSGRPFPHRVIITVLDALFDLFARAHQANILWNDVKLDHIYWQNETGEVTVIDWGNAQFLSSETEPPQRTLPRWEDYRQMVETLGTFLQHSAPTLYDDLGWGDFADRELDSLQVSVLARRIAYQQQMIAHRVMEYQSLLQLALVGDPSLAGMDKIIRYQRLLEQIGAPWDSAAALVYARALLLSLLADHKTQDAISALTLVEDLFRDHLGLPWHLLREIFRQPDLLAHNLLSPLASSILNEDWLSALWTLTKIAAEDEPAAWWSQLMPVLRQKATGMATPPPYHSVQALLRWAIDQGEKKKKLQAQLSSILSNWRQKGTGSSDDSPFEYAVLPLLDSESDLPLKHVNELKQNFAVGKSTTRELLQRWVRMDWDGLQATCRRLLAWDPDRWALLEIETVIFDFTSWLDHLYRGPESLDDSIVWLTHHLRIRPQPELTLGSPGWLNQLMQMLERMIQRTNTSDDAAGFKAWCPWFQIPAQQQKEPAEIPTGEHLPEILAPFVHHLQAHSDVEGSLIQIKHTAPHIYPYCQQLVDTYQSLLTIRPQTERTSVDCAQAPHFLLQTACQTITQFQAWRSAVENRDLSLAQEILEEGDGSTWCLGAHLNTLTQSWRETIVPQLEAVRTLRSSSEDDFSASEPSLEQSLESITELHRIWQSLNAQGFFERGLDALVDSCEQLRELFFGWRHRVEHTADSATRFLFHVYLGDVRSISTLILNLQEHSRQARLAFLAFSSNETLSMRPALSKAGDFLFHLSKVEHMLIPDSAERLFPDWVNLFTQVINARSQEERQARILDLPESHPLYVWLVQSLLDRQ